MSYGAAPSLQAAIFQRLSTWTALTDLVGTAVFDTPPAGPLPPLYVALGSEDVRDWSDMTAHGAVHDILVSVVGDTGGFQAAKAAAAQVSDALIDADLALERGRLVSLDFLRATARQTGKGQVRRIDLRFRARVEDEEI